MQKNKMDRKKENRKKTETKFMKNRVFVKYGEKEHLQNIIDGTIRFAPAQTYIKMEEELHNKGQGDLLEGKWVIHAESMKMILHDTGETIKMPGKANVIVNIQDVHNMPVFCLTEYGEDYISDTEMLLVPDDELESIKHDFPKATHALIILDDDKFVDAVEVAGEHKIYSDSIHYYNYDINDMNMLSYIITGDGNSSPREKKMAMTYDNRYRHLLCKDEAFANQNEYRFIVLDETSDAPVFYPIQYSGRYKLIEIDELNSPVSIL